MSDASDRSEIERIKERKKRELQSRLTGPDEPVEIEGSEHFEELVDTRKVLLVDFYADWCGPCQMLAPIVEEIAETTDATVAKLDVDEHQDLAQYYGVQSIPVLILFVEGEQTQRLVGMQDQDRIRSLVEKYT